MNGKRTSGFLGNDDGAAAIEFAFVSVMFLFMVFGIIEIGRIYWTWNTMQYALENTTRHALTNADATDEDLEAYAAESMAGIQVDPDRMSISITRSSENEIDFLEMTGTYDYETMITVLPDAMNMTLTATTKMPIP